MPSQFMRGQTRWEYSLQRAPTKARRRVHSMYSAQIGHGCAKADISTAGGMAIRRVTDTSATGRSTNAAIRGVLASGQGGTVPQEPVQRSMAVRALPRRVHSMYTCAIAAPARASQKKSPLSAGSSSIRSCQFGW